MLVETKGSEWDDAGLVFFERERRVRFLYANVAERFCFPQQYAFYRGQVVEWMLDAGEVLRLERSTVHSAVSCFDEYFARNKGVSCNVWQLLASACILVAAKCEETESDPAVLHKLHALNAGFYSKSAIVRMEQELLRILEWDVVRVSAIPFIYYFMEIDMTSTMDTPMHDGWVCLSGKQGSEPARSKGVSTQADRRQGRSPLAYALLAESLRFADIALRASSIALSYRPSVVAAASILCASHQLPGSIEAGLRLGQFLSDAASDVQACLAGIEDLCQHQVSRRPILSSVKSSQSPRSVMELAAYLERTAASQENISGDAHEDSYLLSSESLFFDRTFYPSGAPKKRPRLCMPPPVVPFRGGGDGDHETSGLGLSSSSSALVPEEVDVMCSEELDDAL
ncbi:similar to cyclin E2 [Cyanidioschyzon merolae strain 10D]|uniref:Similar to cyclin E2 n=1 Tax=Cyanidioschyzon merolae (strain NIES-3377 / 10D) TaxID=280699 RepID=M1VDI2_CYAM1|nr:similar to cyclin E2 [Cyanidioschyzon merolae strain 10D]BAM80812.1 similar to cyclin E2 [Cyanidioschyzon merolae strain 10D]|eukprot:XP_005536848.1 similar to cyclin E2 [Cyanidioschyzon merolae strain 10D]